MLLMVEKDIREGICQSIYLYAKANNKYKKDYDKNKESSYLQYWDGKCRKSFLEIVLSGSRILLNLMKISLKTIMKKVIKGYLIKVGVQYLEKLQELHNDIPFLSEKMKIKKSKS